MNPQNAIAALIHDQVGQTLVRVFSGGASGGVARELLDIHVDDNHSLLSQLTRPGDGPPRVSIAFGLDVLGSSVSALLDALPDSDRGPLALLRRADLRELVRRVRDALGGHLGLLAEQRDAIAGLVAAQDPADLREAADRLFAGVVDVLRGSSEGSGDAVNSVSRLRQLLGNDVGIALPFSTVLNAFHRAGQNAATIPGSVESGLLAYFFATDGFRTVDGERIVAPVHISDVKEAAAGAVAERDLSGVQLRSLFSKTTAERYLRDTIRIIVEATYDAGRGWKEPGGRFATVLSGLKARGSAAKPADAIEKHFVTWFRGFASMAESATMRAVEVGTQGVSQFQTNPLIAAAAGSFAGTVARKLGQDAFLGILSQDLVKAK